MKDITINCIAFKDKDKGEHERKGEDIVIDSGGQKAFPNDEKNQENLTLEAYSITDFSALPENVQHTIIENERNRVTEAQLLRNASEVKEEGNSERGDDEVR